MPLTENLFRRCLSLACLTASLVACRPETAQQNQPPVFQSTTDSCQAPQLRWAHRFRMACHDGYLSLTLLEPWRNRGETITYMLHRDDRARSFGKDTLAVRIPLQRLATLVSVQSAFVTALRASDRIYAVASKHYLFDSTLRQRIDAGLVAEVGDGAALDLEKVILLHLDGVLHGGSADPTLDGSARLTRAGLIAIQGGEWMESHPLGRAEWIQFYGAFLGQVGLADSIFRSVEKKYLALRDSLKNQLQTTTVFCGAPWQGVWHTPGGHSYPAQLAQDAGLRYLWSDDTTEGSLPLTPEAVLARAADADLWLNPGSFSTLKQAASDDSRYAHLSAFRKGDVFAPTRRSTPDGGNDYWESAVVHPEILLADLARIAQRSPRNGTEASQTIGNPESTDLFYWRRLPRE